MLLPLRGVWGVWVPFTQGAALGYVLLPLRGVPLVSFDFTFALSDINYKKFISDSA